MADDIHRKALDKLPTARSAYRKACVDSPSRCVMGLRRMH